MKRKNLNQFPPGLDKQKVREIIEHYDNQTEEEFIAELDAVDRRANELRRQKLSEEEIDKILEQEVEGLIKSVKFYPVWSPYKSFEAANTLLQVLNKKDKEGE